MAPVTTGQGEPAGLHPTIEQYKNVINHASYRASLRITGSDILTEDIAQEVRFHLSQGLDSGKIHHNAVRTRHHKSGARSHPL